MSTATFDGTPIVVKNRPTTYGELRKHAESTIQETTPEAIDLAIIVDRELVPGAIRGAMHVILTLLDEIERLTEEEA